MDQTKHQRRGSNRVVYIVDGTRTPQLKFRGAPGKFPATDLAVQAGKSLLTRQNFSKDLIDEVILGCVGPAADEANIARIVALRLGLSKSIPAWTVQRNCASGLQAIDSAFKNIQNGYSDIVLAGGTEAMSHAPLMFSKAFVTWLASLNKAKAFGQKLQAAIKFRPNLLAPVVALLKGLNDPVVNLSMGQTAENLAYQFEIDRDQMDEFAAKSHKLAIMAQNNDIFKDEISPIYDKDSGKVFTQDDGVRADSTKEKLGKLKPVFEKFGNVTAGNSSQITDGAALVILASEDAVKKHNLPVMAKITEVEWAALAPEVMGLGPAHAIAPLMVNNNLKFTDLKQLEINEAFAAQVIACVKAMDDDNFCKTHLGLDQKLGLVDENILNPNGGAIALGHPVGSSGARLVLHLARGLKGTNDKAIGSLCIGGGQGGAILLEGVK